MSQIGVVYTTVASHKQATQLAKEAVILGLAACAILDNLFTLEGQQNAEENNAKPEGVPDHIHG